jgi:hypothetical protein
VRYLSTIPAFGILCAALACGQNSDSAAGIQRTDSAGIEIVINSAPDRALGWTTRVVLQLGGEDSGPASFYQVQRSLVDLDGDGNLYVLDRQSAHVTKFDAEGHALWTVGGTGGGPGEFLFPTNVTATPGGGVTIFDRRKRVAMRFGADGALLDQVPLPRGNYWAFGRLDAGYLAQQLLYAEGRLSHRLRLFGPMDSVVLAQTTPVADRVVRYESCGAMAAALQSRIYPIFTPELPWHASRQALAANGDRAYMIDVFDGQGTLVRSVRRTVPVHLATAEEAEAWAVANPVIFSMAGGGECVMSPAEIVEKHGFLDSVPAVVGLALADDGSLWARRWSAVPDGGPIDVFGPDGGYEGTLPADFPFPIRFMPTGDLVVVQRDSMDVERIEVLGLVK